MSHWCDFCQDSFEIDHFEDGCHKVGSAFGPEGLTMWKLRELHRLATEISEPPNWRDEVLVILNTREPR
jgi:hypothetical protein